MSPVRASCPACGGPVDFKVSTALVTVCPYCNSVLGRGDKGLEDLGKVADLVESGSPLDLWLKGRFEGVPFDLTGRVQYAHPAGGVWDEWYAHFADDRWGWLAEAQGRFYLTFQAPTPPDLPAFDELRLGQPVAAGPGAPPLMVAEKNTGRAAAAKGEIPFRLVPNREHPFADLSGPGGAFGTLDYSESPPLVFLGREVTLDGLGIPPSARRQVPLPERAPAVQLNCPHCGGALTLHAPDRSERVGCPNCGSLLDVREGKLRLLQSLHPPKVQPAIPLGSVGKYQGAEWTLIGFMQRSVRIEGTDYFWEEYLLYQARLGFRWLTRSDDHWNWVEPLPPGEVRVEGKEARYADKGFRLFQKAKARVVFVVGEFYWKVQAGESVQSRDYVNAPEMLSEEVTKEGGEGEINWSRALYLTPDEVERMFGLKASLPSPSGIGPNQPFPHAGVYRYALYLLAAAVAVGLLMWALSPRRVVFDETFRLNPPGGTAKTRTVMVKDPLKLRGHRNIRVSLESKSAQWVHVRGELVPYTTTPPPGGKRPPASRGRAETFTLTAPAGRESRVYLSAVPAGEYTLRLDAQWEQPKQEVQARVRVEQGVAHLAPWVVSVLILLAVPFATGLYQLYWESRRWQDSNV